MCFYSSSPPYILGACDDMDWKREIQLSYIFLYTFSLKLIVGLKEWVYTCINLSSVSFLLHATYIFNLNYYHYTPSVTYFPSLMLLLWKLLQYIFVSDLNLATNNENDPRVRVYVSAYAQATASPCPLFFFFFIHLIFSNQTLKNPNKQLLALILDFVRRSGGRQSTHTRTRHFLRTRRRPIHRKGSQQKPGLRDVMWQALNLTGSEKAFFRPLPF